jgi:hypothetical protein
MQAAVQLGAAEPCVRLLPFSLIGTETLFFGTPYVAPRLDLDLATEEHCVRDDDRREGSEDTLRYQAASSLAPVSSPVPPHDPAPSFLERCYWWLLASTALVGWVPAYVTSFQPRWMMGALVASCIILVAAPVLMTRKSLRQNAFARQKQLEEQVWLRTLPVAPTSSLRPSMRADP